MRKLTEYRWESARNPRISNTQSLGCWFWVQHTSKRDLAVCSPNYYFLCHFLSEFLIVYLFKFFRSSASKELAVCRSFFLRQLKKRIKSKEYEKSKISRQIKRIKA